MPDSDAEALKQAEAIGHNMAVKARRSGAWGWVVVGLLLVAASIALNSTQSQPAREARGEYVAADAMAQTARDRGDTKAAEEFERQAGRAAGREVFASVGALIGLAGIAIFFIGAWKRLRAGRMREN